MSSLPGSSWFLQIMVGGMIVTTGMVWFFTEAWIFAVQVRATWLLVLLIVTSTAALSAQSYLCVVVASNYRVVRTAYDTFFAASDLVRSSSSVYSQQTYLQTPISIVNILRVEFS